MLTKCITNFPSSVSIFWLDSSSSGGKRELKNVTTVYYKDLLLMSIFWLDSSLPLAAKCETGNVKCVSLISIPLCLLFV